MVSSLALALSLTIAGNAAADDDLERARSLFEEAGELEKQGEWKAAQERLRAALRIRETPHLHYALGWALENDGDLEEARSEYDLSIRLAKSAAAGDVERLATQRIQAIQTRERRAKGTKSTKDLGAASSARSAGEPSKTLPIVVMVGGGALAITGVALLVSAANDVSIRDSNTQRWCELTACSGATATLPESDEAALARREAVNAADRGNTKQVAGAIVGSVGLVGIAVGTYLLIDAGRSREGRAPSTRVSVDATSLPGGAFGSATLSF